MIVAVWEYLFNHTSPTHTAAAVKGKAANKDISKRLAYGPENFFSGDETRQDVCDKL